MDSYGYIYLHETQSVQKDIIDQICRFFSIVDQDSFTYDVAYRQAIAIFRKLLNREPTIDELEELHGPAKERFRVMSKGIKVEREGELVKYSHPMFSIENVCEIAKRLSALNTGVCH